MSAAELRLLITARDEAAKVLASAGEKLRSFGSTAMQTGSNISNGLRPLTDVISRVGMEAVDMASSMAESLSKVRVVFKESAGAIEEWAKTSATSLGISQQKALDAAGTFGNLFTAMGLSRGEASKMSIDVVKLAADLASFNNIKPEEALEKLKAGLVGQSEPLRSLGVNLSVATMEAHAMKAGIGEAGKELTDAEKIQARFGLILSQTTAAQGDFTRTSDGLANQLRIQKAEQENVKAQLGEALLPIMQEFTKIVRGATSAFLELSPEMKNAVMILGAILVAAGPVLTIVGFLSSAVGVFIGALGFLGAAGVAVIAALALVVVAFLQVKETVDLVRANWDLFVHALTTGRLNDIPVFGFFFEKIQTLIGVIGTLVGMWNGFTSAISNFQMPSISLPSFSLPGFADGGIVPGPIGTPIPVMAHGGERFLGIHGASRGAGGGDIHVHFEGPVYGVLDLEQKVKRIVRDAYPQVATA